MSERSRIEWTNATWNPVTGCTPVSAGCRNCYALRMARRLQAMGKPAYARGFEVAEHPGALEVPFSWRQPRMVFVCSMGDLFHERVSDYFIRQVFDVIVGAEQHTFQILTKRPERAARLAPALPWPQNLWLGTSVELSAQRTRLSSLCECAARVLFVSLEPLLGPVDLRPWLRRGRRNLLDWVIVGGETGPGRRPMDPEWPRLVRDQCAAARLPFFFKRWGHLPSRDQRAHELDGVTYHQLPRPRGRSDR